MNPDHSLLFTTSLESFVSSLSEFHINQLSIPKDPEGRAATIFAYFVSQFNAADEALHKDYLGGTYHLSSIASRDSPLIRKTEQLLKDIENSLKEVLVLKDINPQMFSDLGGHKDYLQALERRFELFHDLGKYVQGVNRSQIRITTDCEEKSQVYNIRNAISEIRDMLDNEANSPLNARKKEDVIHLLNIRAALLDHNLNCGNTYFRECQEYLKICSESSISSFFPLDILVEKVNFLRIKSLFRRDRRNRNIGHTINYKFETDSIKYYNHFYELFEQNYIKGEVRETNPEKKKDRDQKIKTFCTSNKTAQLADPNLLVDIFSFLKGFSDGGDNPNESDFKMLIRLDSKIQKIFSENSAFYQESNTIEFDKLSVRSIGWRTNRTIYKVKCKKYTSNIHAFSDSKIISELEDLKYELIKRIAFEDNILQNKDYYLYQLYLESYNSFLNEIDTHNKEIELDKFLSLNDYAFGLFKKFSDGINWMKEHTENLTTYLPFQKCITEYNINSPENSSNSIKLFLDSTYIAPLDFREADDKLSMMKEDFNKHRTSKTAKLLRKQLDKTKNDVVKEIHSGHLKGIELLSLFAAAIAFVVTAIAAVPKFDNLALLLFFLWGLCTTLLLFILGINAIMGVNKRGNIKGYLMFTSFLVLGTTAFFLLYHFNPFDSKENNSMKRNASQENSTTHEQIISISPTSDSLILNHKSTQSP